MNKSVLGAKLFCLVATGVALSVSSPALAVPVYGTSAAAALTDARDVPGGGLVANDPDWLDSVLSWVIVDNLDNTFTYTYTFTGVDRPAISHFVLDLTDEAILGPDASDNPGLVTGATVNGVLIALEDLEFGDHEGIVGAVKFDVGDPEDPHGAPLIYSFTSNRVPVWGDFVVKGGDTSSMTNSGFGDRVSMDSNLYIARPDGVVPEPAMLSLGAMGAGLMLFRRRRTPA